MPSSYTLEDAQQFERSRDLLKAADIYQELGEFERAKALYLALERQYPFHKHVKFKLGQLFTRMEAWDEAIVKLQEVRNSGIFLEDTLYLLAECFQRKGLIYAARELYVDLLERNYQYKDAREKLRALDTPGVSSLTTMLPGSATTFGQSSRTDAFQTLQGLPVEDRYVLMEELGRGGMGVVYKALEKPSNRPVAIKVLPPYLAQDEMNRVRFFREAEIVARFRHPHIVSILETNQQENFIVMEYVPGGTLDAWVAGHAVSKPDLLRFLRQILDALHVAHEQGIIHRDMKPDNILIADEHTAKLTDFGIAHICGATITHTGMHLGTLPYMSPEQILGQEIDHRSDIYAVGVILYKLMTGTLPFTGQETSYHHIHTLPRPPRELVSALSPELNAIILKCLAKRPEDRFANARLLQKALMTNGATVFC